MYNKLHEKILDSSIWLESSDTRVVWITMLAAMNQDGFVRMATMVNLAKRANVPLDACRKAVEILEGPEVETATPEDDGRRIERVPGGWMVLKSEEHNKLAKGEQIRAQTRERVRAFREKKRNAKSNATPLQEPSSNASETPSVSGSVSGAKKEQKTCSTALSVPPKVDPLDAIYQAYPRHVGKRAALVAIDKAVKRLVAGEDGKAPMMPEKAKGELWKAAAKYAKSPAGQQSELTPHPATWFNQSRYLDDEKEWSIGGSSNAKQNPRSSAAVVEHSRDALQEFVRRESSTTAVHRDSSVPPGSDFQPPTLAGTVGDLRGRVGDVDARAAHDGLFAR